MLRSTSALFDSASARSLFSRFGASDAGEVDAEADESPVNVSDDEPEVPRLGSFEVMNRTIDIAQAALARHTLAAYPPDLLIEVPRSACRSLEFHRAAEVIEIGRTLAAKALDNFDASQASSPAIER
jgi:NTE family protein